MNAVIALGLTASGSCNSKITNHLRQVFEAEQLNNGISQTEYEAEQLNNGISQTEYEADKAFFIHFSQGLVHLGRVGERGLCDA